MPLIFASLEPPEDPKSWSGSSKLLVQSLRKFGVVDEAIHVQLSPLEEGMHLLANAAWPLDMWKARYKSSSARHKRFSEVARTTLLGRKDTAGILQIGARFSCLGIGIPPVFGYHDGNAAVRYRFFDRGLLSPDRQATHLAWEREVYSGMAGIFVMSKWLASSFITDFGIPASKIHVVGAGINFETLPAVPARSFAEPKFLFVGKEFERKGGEYLLQAFSKVHAAMPSATLTIVGPPVPATAPRGVIYEGFLSRSNPAQLQRLNALFAASTALVLPSIYEPFGISLLEGMAYGLPCVTVNRCALPEIVIHGSTGLVAQPEDAASLADALMQLASDPERARTMGNEGRRSVELTQTWDAVARRIKEILGSVYDIH